MSRWSLFLFPGALVCGVVAALSGRWLVALLSYLIAVVSTLNIVADLDPEGESRPAAIELAQDVIVVPKPRTKTVRLASAGLAMKAGLALTLPALAGAATGILPPTVQNWVADAVRQTVGLDIPGGRPADERRGASNPGQAEGGPVDPAPAPGAGASGASPPVASPGDAGAPSADQGGPPNATSSEGPSEGGDGLSPPLRVPQEPDPKIEVPTPPPPLPLTPVLPPVDPGVPEVGNEGGLGLNNQSLPSVDKKPVPRVADQGVPSVADPVGAKGEAIQAVPTVADPVSAKGEAIQHVPSVADQRLLSVSDPVGAKREAIQHVPRRGQTNACPEAGKPALVARRATGACPSLAELTEKAESTQR
ncbi:MAG: hypothetical protein M3396_07210 [Actinomycetota bacterium]|nr:hypothetical protein [Actinomycetota bacterium]MDQ3573732.1 hypothetical protein [Actinomycetota bacterium]